MSQAALDVPPRGVARRCLNVPPQSAGRRPGRRHRGRDWRTPPRDSDHTVGKPLRRPAPSSQPQVLSQGLKGMEEDAFIPDLLPWSFHLLGKNIIERIYARTFNLPIPINSSSFNAVWRHCELFIGLEKNFLDVISKTTELVRCRVDLQVYLSSFAYAIWVLNIKSLTLGKCLIFIPLLW